MKFIRNNDVPNTRPGSTLPGGGIGTVATFGQEITYDNAVLDATTRGYSLTVLEYLDITPPRPLRRMPASPASSPMAAQP